ncbi:MAG: 16S rRNA (cytidine(1402)-2'-O)-methyltransferase [Chloroflexi bacterium UTCFX4]|nr:MAG: 16S rRNA (cytidine(1402)-2'-O)-methyltransferase [Chloroflexi bacterium UTCFX4]
MHILYLIATPIGNLQDISPRALETLRAVSLIAAEDTRTAKQLLNYFDIHTPVTSFFEHSKQNKINHILDALEKNDVAVISEAGTPGINDPGYELVREAIARGYRVSPIPGASAVLTALVASGISANAFYYVGFLPREPQARRKFLRELVNERDTIIAFETPHRLRDALKDLENIFGATRKICVARELTKKFEEFQRGTIGQVREHFEKNEVRGEFTLVIAGATADNGRRTTNVVWDDARIVKEMRALLKKGVPRTEAVKRIAKASGRERRAVYEMMLNESR